MAEKKLIFYANPQSRSRIVRWMLEEVGASYATKVIEYGAQMKSASYLSINPMGKVPTIVHGDKTVTECAAICAYLADVFPDAKLAPMVEGRAAYYRWLFFGAGPLESAVMNKAMKFEIPQEKEVMMGYGNYDLVVETLAKAVSENPYVAGATFTAADVYIGAQVGWGLEFKTLPDRKEFVEYFEKLKIRPAYLRANELDDALIKSSDQKS